MSNNLHATSTSPFIHRGKRACCTGAEAEIAADVDSCGWIASEHALEEFERLLRGELLRKRKHEHGIDTRLRERFDALVVRHDLHELGRRE